MVKILSHFDKEGKLRVRTCICGTWLSLWQLSLSCLNLNQDLHVQAFATCCKETRAQGCAEQLGFPSPEALL